MTLVGRHRAFNDGLQRTSLTTWYARVHRPRLEVVQQQTSCEDTKADPGDVGPEAIRGSSVSSDRSGQSPLLSEPQRYFFALAFSRAAASARTDSGSSLNRSRQPERKGTAVARRTPDPPRSNVERSPTRSDKITKPTHRPLIRHGSLSAGYSRFGRPPTGKRLAARCLSFPLCPFRSSAPFPLQTSSADRVPSRS